LPESEILEGESAAQSQDCTEQPGQQEDEKAHGLAILLQLRVTTISAVDEVFADYAALTRPRGAPPSASAMGIN
jgi:hypothetical protein